MILFKNHVRKRIFKTGYGENVLCKRACVFCSYFDKEAISGKLHWENSVTLNSCYLDSSSCKKATTGYNYWYVFRLSVRIASFLVW